MFSIQGNRYALIVAIQDILLISVIENMDFRLVMCQEQGKNVQHGFTQVNQVEGIHSTHEGSLDMGTN